MPEGILEDVAKRLKDTDSRVREAGAYALRGWLDPGNELVIASMVRLYRFVLMDNCVPVLGTQSTLLKELLKTTLSEGFLEETLLKTLLEARALW